MTAKDILIDAAAEKTHGRINITEDTSISELNIDSLSFMDLVMFVEDQQNMMLENEDIEKILAARTIGELICIFDAAAQK